MPVRCWEYREPKYKRHTYFNPFLDACQPPCQRANLRPMESPLVKVLVVDDDPALRQLLADYLNRHHYDTLLAPDASDLAARLQRYSPALSVNERIKTGGHGTKPRRPTHRE